MAGFFHELWLEWPALLSSLKWTVVLSASITLSGLLGAGLLLYLLTHHSRALRLAAQAYVTFFVAVPLLALLFLMYYGLPTVGCSPSPFVAAFIGFTLNISAYNAQYLMNGYRAIPHAEMTAAQAMGYSRWQIYRVLILPQSIRYAIPGLISQMVSNLKDSSIAFLIQFDGFLSFIQNFTAQNFFFFRGYLFAAVGYLIMVALLSRLARHIQQRTRIPGFA